MTDRTPTERRAQREPVTMTATCRTATGGFGKVEILDLTSEGCRIFLRGMRLREDQHLRLQPEGFQPLAGVVRWVAGGDAGIEFDSAIYAPVVEHLQAKFARNRR